MSTVICELPGVRVKDGGAGVGATEVDTLPHFAPPEPFETIK
jgi:hypothetical protein